MAEEGRPPRKFTQLDDEEIANLVADNDSENATTSSEENDED